MILNFLKKKDKFELIEKKLFDKKYYKATYTVSSNEKNLFKHFREKGWKLNYNPNEWFSVKDYLEQNIDVANANIDPFYHFLRFGLSEGRRSIRVTQPQSEFNKKDNYNKHDNEESFCKYPNTSIIHSNKILIIATFWLSQCKLYRVDAKIEQLEKIGFEVECFSYEDSVNCINALQTAELVIMYRLPWIAQVHEYFDEARRLGLKIIYDIDDVIFDQEIYDKMLSACDLPSETKNRLSNDAKLYAKCLLLADEVWVTTQTLKNIVVQKYKKLCNIIPNGINGILNEYAQEADNFYKRSDSHIIKLFYGSGTNTHNEDILSIQPVLNKILIEYSNVHLYLVGEIDIQFCDEVNKQIHFVDKVQYEDYYYLISKFDIALIPLKKSTFNEAKSNLKFIEASILGIPSIASALVEYSSVIRDGENGFLANNEEEWYKKLKILIENEEARNTLSSQAKTDVKKIYSYDVISDTMKGLVNKYIDKSNSPISKKNLLIVNVLYGVSSFGGATVVAEGLAENTQKLSDYNVYVFSTHSDNHLPYGTLKRYMWNNVEVFSVNVPYISKCYSNQEIGKIFKNIISIINPVVVHFHCIQTMGLEMVELCLHNSIPYVITIHDGWWRCNNQFLMDSFEKYCGDNDLSCELCKSRCGLKNIEFYKRLHKCEKALTGAQIVYTPSNYFTDFTRKDFPSVNLKTNSNGIIDCLYKGNKSPIKERTQKLVFGFLGGKDYVKGFDFIQKILNKKDSSKFSLLLIDTAKRTDSPGLYKPNDVNCEIEIIGYTPHEKMLDVYSKIDVLLFPSKGKESFGLVVREAIANDVFVISSRCGGPSEAVVDGENGFLFDLGDIDMFEKCIDKVLANISYYINYKTTNFGDVRSFAAQAQDLLQDYDSILNMG